MRDETIGICFALRVNIAYMYTSTSTFTYQISSVSHVEGLTNISQMQNSEQARLINTDKSSCSD